VTEAPAPGAVRRDAPAPGAAGNPEVYATPGDLAARWRPLAPDEEARAGVLLADASAVLRATDDTLDARIAAGVLDPNLVRGVVCAMVKRAMVAGLDVEGVTQQSQTAGPYAASVSYANPSGSLYVTRAERRALGITTQRAFTVSMARDEPPRPRVHPFITDQDYLLDGW